GGEWLREQSPQEASENEYRTSNLRFQGLMLIFFFYLTQRLRPKAKKKAADCSAAFLREMRAPLSLPGRC
ncbi:MAG TPA: hypothetical protein VMS78_11675, partial [Rhizomicrobium sp.]|nr:hypothetical protein [Rhizomicrobium sp.]